jgi:hypothetical protein
MRHKTPKPEPEVQHKELYIQTLYFLSKADKGLLFEDLWEKNKGHRYESPKDLRELLDSLARSGMVGMQGEAASWRYVLTQYGVKVYEIEQNKFENLKILAPLEPTFGAQYASVQLQKVREALNQARLDALIYAGKNLDDIAVQNLQIAKSVLDRIIEESQQTSKLLLKYIEGKPL